MELENWIFAVCFVASFPSSESAFNCEIKKFQEYRISAFCKLKNKLIEAACATFLDKIVHAKNFSFCNSYSNSSCFDSEDGKAYDAVTVIIDNFRIDMRRNEAHFLFLVYCFLHFERVVKSSSKADLQKTILIFTKMNDYIKQVTRTLD